MSRTGDIHHLPVEDHPDADQKPRRPWLLVHTPKGNDSDRCVLAYGTTQDTEQVEGAAPLDLSWRRNSGEFTDTRFFSARIRNQLPPEIAGRVGHARENADEIRDAFAAAVGIGTGVGPGPFGSMARGHVVAMSSIIANRIGTDLGVILTTPEYAQRRRHQIILPIYDARNVDLQDGEVTSPAGWVADLPGAPAEVVLAIPSVFSECEPGRPRTPRGIVGFVEIRLDAETMIGVDEALTAYFGL